MGPAHVLVDHDLGAVADRDAGRFLAAMLQREQAEAGQVNCGLPRISDAENAAGLFRATSRARDRAWPEASTVGRPSNNHSAIPGRGDDEVDRHPGRDRTDPDEPPPGRRRRSRCS